MNAKTARVFLTVIKLFFKKFFDFIECINFILSFCDYFDFSTFYRNFKKFTGISPYSYKISEKKVKK